MSKKLDNIIKSDKQFIIDISGKCYVRDEMSGDIVEYPFEKMDPNQIMELYKNDNGGINLYVDKVEDKYNPERNYNSYQIKDIDKDGNPTELEEDNTYDDIDEIFL